MSKTVIKLNSLDENINIGRVEVRDGKIYINGECYPAIPLKKKLVVEDKGDVVIINGIKVLLSEAQSAAPNSHPRAAQRQSKVDIYKMHHVDQEVEFDVGDGGIGVNCPFGNVKIVPTKTQKCHAHWVADIKVNEGEELHLEKVVDADGYDIVALVGEGNYTYNSFMLEISIPENVYAYAIETKSADVTASKPIRAQYFHVNSISGDIRVNFEIANGGALSFNVTSGDYVGNINFAGGGELELSTVSGDVRAGLNANGDVQCNISSVSGDVDLRTNLGCSLNISSVSGDVRTKNSGTHALCGNASTVSGDITIHG